MSIPKKVDVVVCGAGPVGLLAACLLGKYQIPTVLVEKNSEPYEIPRAIALDDETLRILQVIGLHRDFEQIAKKAAGLQLCSQKGKALFTITKRAVSGKDASFLFYSPLLENLLRNRLKEYKSVKSFYSAELLKVQTTKNAVLSSMAIGQNLEQIQSKYLIACDGANSSIRKKIGLSWQNYGYTATNLKIDLELHQNIRYSDYIKKFVGPKGKAYVFLDSWHKHKRVEFSLPKQDQNKSHIDKLPEILKTDDFSILHEATYQFKSGTAKQWLKNKVALAGDAAHLMPPYIGQGMCAGFRDVHNLCSKLMLIEKQGFSTKILDSYQKERKPHVRFVIGLTVGVGLLFTSPLRYFLFVINCLLPQALHRFEAPPIKLKKGFFMKSHLAGQLFPQNLVLDAQQRAINSDAFLKEGFNLIFFVEKGRNFEHIPKQTSLKSRIKTLQICVTFIHLQVPKHKQKPAHFVDQGAFSKWFAKHKQHALLLRPDKYIFCSCSLKSKSEQKQIEQVIKMTEPLCKMIK